MITIYHGTSLKSFESIISDKEFKANIGTGVNSWTPDCIYFATEFGVAEAHGYGAGASHNWEENGGVPFVVFEMEVDENILLPDYDNNSECKDWKESAKKNGQVCIKHKLQISPLTKIHFIGGMDYNTHVKTDLINWKKDLRENLNRLLVPAEEDY